MKVKKQILIKQNVSNDFDNIIVKLGVNRSAAIEKLMQKFIDEQAVNSDRLKVLMSNINKFMQDEQVRTTGMFEKEIYTQFSVISGTISPNILITALIYDFIQLSSDEQCSIIYGV